MSREPAPGGLRANNSPAKPTSATGRTTNNYSRARNANQVQSAPTTTERALHDTQLSPLHEHDRYTPERREGGCGWVGPKECRGWDTIVTTSRGSRNEKGGPSHLNMHPTDDVAL